MTALSFIIDEESRMSEMIPGDMYPLIEGLLIDFAKLKVKEALQAAENRVSDEGNCHECGGGLWISNKGIIPGAYPLTNIM